MQEFLRFSRPGDEEQLKELWAQVFGDSREYIDMFFGKLYEPGMAAVYLIDGQIVSAAYVLRLGELVVDGRWTPCREIYAYGTLPEYRGRGCGGRVLELARKAALDGGVAMVCPSEKSLFPYYEKYNFKTYFYTGVHDCTDVGLPLNGSVTRVTVRGYAALREELLHDVPHIDYDIKVLELQEAICSAAGGGLWYVVSDGVRGCAVSEPSGDTSFIRELIMPSGSQYNAAALVARASKAQAFSYRAPVRAGEEAEPYAMICSADEKPDLGRAWLGFAFD